MLTRDTELNIDFGLHITFDSKTYHMLMPNCQNEYPLGGLICEYTRLAPTELKILIMGCSGLEKPATTENFIDTFMELHGKLIDNQLPVIGTMVTVEFMNTAEDWFEAVRTDRVEEFKQQLLTDTYESVKEFIFEDTGYSDVGGETVLQLLLTCYFSFASTYVITKALFTQIMESNEVQDERHERSVELLTAMYSNFMDAQHIDFRVILIEDALKPMYTIKTSVSLLLFEMANCINNEVNVVKCKNCGHYFVPGGRSDTVYCSYPLEDNKEKNCKDVGAQLTRANKEKTDIVTREYRKVYMRYKMAISRHPEDKEIVAKFNQLTNEIKIRRAEIMSGESTVEELLEWLSSEF